VSPLRVGELIHGFVGGQFGRDHFDCSRIEAIGADWVVARPLEPTYPPVFAAGAYVLDAVADARGESDYPHHVNCPEWS